MALTFEVHCPCGGKYASFGNGLNEAAKLLYAYNKRIYRYWLNF
jgi:hypothetical protein